MAQSKKPATSSLLSQLSFVNEAPLRAGVIADPKERRRTNFLASLTQQQQVVAAAIKGEKFTVDRKHWETVRENGRIKYGEDGKTVRQQVEGPVQIDPWYYEGTDKNFYMSAWYSVKKLPIGPSGATTIKCGPKLENVAQVLKVLIESTTTGELDDMLMGLKLGNRQKA